LFREEITQAVRRAVEMVDQGLIREDEIDEKLLGIEFFTTFCISRYFVGSVQ
jgi:undecaprenyl pyrophosphate synthase